MKELRVGIAGFGTVGAGVADILAENGELIRQRLGLPVRLTAVADIDTTSDRGVSLAPGILTDDLARVVEGPDVDVVVETIGGTGVAYDAVTRALAAGKHVVTANKALLASRGADVFAKAAEAGVRLGFEAAVGGGIPVIKALREGLAANRITAVYGIINGTTNYILSEMAKTGRPFDAALAEAKELGYAEPDPTMDISGHDTAHKIAILATLAFGTIVGVDDVYVEGITDVSPEDIGYAAEFGYAIKMLGIAKVSDGRIEVRAHPTLIPSVHLLASVDGVYNAAYVVGDRAGRLMLYGEGAGRGPAASAVVADIMDIATALASGAEHAPDALRLLSPPRDVKPMAQAQCRYYFRFTTVDQPGVLGSIAAVLGRRGISIASVIQKARRAGETVPIIMLTHEALESEVRAALEEIDALPYARAKTILMRIEENE